MCIIFKTYYFVRLLKRYFRYGNWAISKSILKYELPVRNISYHRKLHTIYLKDLDIHISVDRHQQLLKGYNFALALTQSIHADWQIDRDDHLVVEIKNIKMYVDTYEELFILNEIYIKNNYQFHDRHDVIVIDIGMNVGFASLYFAQMSSVKKVYGYEPFAQTFRAAMKNFTLNKKIAKKIVAFNFGLDVEDKTLTVPYCYDCKGQLSTEAFHEKFQNSTSEKVKVHNFLTILDEISNEHKNEKLIIKMDCEGSEFKLLEYLVKNNKIKSSIVYMIEWHEKEPNILIDYLVENGFAVFSFPENIKIGMLYAVRCC